MKKALLSFLMLLVLISVSSAQVFIGSRQAGMGGTGVAAAVGLNAVAYNPAGIMAGPAREFLLSLGASTQGLDKIANSISSVSNPAQFMLDNYNNALDANGTLAGILGFNINQVGLSILLPSVRSSLNKSTGTLQGTFEALGSGAIVLTFGNSFPIPGVPFGFLDAGINLKSVYTGLGSLTVSGDPTVGSSLEATESYWVGSGYGLDIGARVNIAIPAVTEFSVGIAMRNISQTIGYKPKSRADTYTLAAPGGTPALTKGTETEGAEVNATSPTVTALGCAGTVPGMGLKFAADIESASGGTGVLAAASDTVTHLGIEYPVILDTLILRAGTASGQNISVTTWGAKIDILLLTLEIANIIDAKNPKNTSYVIDAGITF